jgi:benzodiazapine receptor
MNNPLFQRIVVAISIVAMIVINVLANIIPYNGKLTGEISDSFAIYFVPAGYVFSIWGLIYLLLGVYAVYQLMPKTYTNRALNAVSWWVVVSSIANSAWILLWHYQYFYTTIAVMVVLLVSLLMIYVRLAQEQKKKPSAQFTWSARLPFSVYLGWISVATIANASGVLTLTSWNGFGIEGMWWSAIMIAVATVLGLLMLVRERDIAYTLVLVWAFVGIGMKFADVPELAQVAYFAAALLALVSLVVFVQKKRK